MEMLKPYNCNGSSMNMMQRPARMIFPFAFPGSTEWFACLITTPCYTDIRTCTGYVLNYPEHISTGIITSSPLATSDYGV